jgi:hypothetical protein
LVGMFSQRVMTTLASRLVCKYRRARCQGHTSKESLIPCLEKAPANWRMLDVSEAVGIVLKKDSGYGFGETRLGQG